MSNLGMDFGKIGSVSGAGGGIKTDHFREAHERAVGETESAGQSGETRSFGEFMKEMANETNAAHLQADSKMQDIAAGRNKDLHGAVLAMEKADIQFRMLTQVRNKVIEAYREIMRMQV